METTDNQLLEEYAKIGAELAFRELVRRHINMVHSAALREAAGNVPLAEEITQDVFTECARRAAKLSSHPTLAGWLYTCVRQMAANARRSEQRRQRREQEAFTMNELDKTSQADQLWQQIRPVLDDAMHELSQEDRTAVVLRFFEGHSLREVGVSLGVSENAARMRVERSLEKLHALLSRRGIRSTATTLAVVLVAGTVLSTSSSFAATIATAAMTSAAGGSTILAKLLTAAKSKLGIAATAAVLGSAFILWHQVHNKPTTLQTLAQPPLAAALVSSPASNSTENNSATPSISTATNSTVTSQMAFQLVDAETSEPLPGAKLHLFYLREDGRGTGKNTVTDNKGRANIDIPATPYHGLNFFVTAASHVPMVTSWGFRRSMPSAYTMKLARGTTIGGTVVDEKGQPVAGAKIEFDTPGGNDPSAEANIQYTGDAAAVTDANGKWSSDMMPKTFDEMSLRVKHEAYAETNLTFNPHAANANSLVITMPAGFSIKGLVVDLRDNPITGAKLRKVHLNDDEKEQSETTDDSGAFEFKTIGAGELTLAAQAEGFAPGVHSLNVTGSVTALKFQLGPGEILRGRVVDEQGNPVAHAFIETTRRGMDKIRWSTNSDADGRFQWNSAPEEPLLYSVLAEGFNRAYAQSLPADNTEQVIKLTHYQPDKDAIQITGTVTDADAGKPMDSFKVFVGEQQSDWAFPLDFYTTGKAGKFTISMPAKSSHPGYVVQIEQEGYSPAVSVDLLTSSGNQKLDFKLHRGSGPGGVVLLPDGSPAADASVLLCTPLGGATIDSPAHIEVGINTTTYRAQTDSSGKFSLPAAVQPQGVIIVHSQGYADLSPADLSAGGNITLQAWGSVKGTAMAGSQPGANQHLILRNQILRYTDAGRRFNYLNLTLQVTTDAEGKFAFEKVPPGSYQLRRNEDGFAADETTVTVSAGLSTEASLGGHGRAIVGKAMVASATDSIDWQKVSVSVSSASANAHSLRPKREDFSTPEAYIAAFKNFMDAHQNDQYFHTCCRTDGSFQLADVGPGVYELKIEVRDSKSNSALPHSDPSPVLDSLTREITIPEDKADEPIDLGNLELLPQPSTASVGRGPG